MGPASPEVRLHEQGAPLCVIISQNGWGRWTTVVATRFCPPSLTCNILRAGTPKASMTSSSWIPTTAHGTFRSSARGSCRCRRAQQHSLMKEASRLRKDLSQNLNSRVFLCSLYKAFPLTKERHVGGTLRTSKDRSLCSGCLVLWRIGTRQNTL